MVVRTHRGERYGIEKPFGLSILVLGESSYDCDDNRDGLLPPFWSESIIRGVYQERRDNSITRAACVFSGELESFAWRQDFWRTAAFNNYVQHSAGSRARQRPTKEKWEYGRTAFPVILGDVKPEFVLVLGKELWQMAFRRDEQSSNVISLGNGAKPFCLLNHEGGFAFAFGINHPSSWGWKYAEWSPWVKTAMEKARYLHAHYEAK